MAILRRLAEHIITSVSMFGGRIWGRCRLRRQICCLRGTEGLSSTWTVYPSFVTKSYIHEKCCIKSKQLDVETQGIISQSSENVNKCIGNILSIPDPKSSIKHACTPPSNPCCPCVHRSCPKTPGSGTLQSLITVSSPSNVPSVSSPGLISLVPCLGTIVTVSSFKPPSSSSSAFTSVVSALPTALLLPVG